MYAKGSWAQFKEIMWETDCLLCCLGERKQLSLQCYLSAQCCLSRASWGLVGDVSSGFREWLMASWSCCGERWWTKSIFGLESADFWMCLESSSKSKCMLTKQSQFKDAVKAGILKKFLNGKIVGVWIKKGWKLLFLFHSQNHRVVENKRHLWRSSNPTPLLKKVQLHQVALGCVQLGFK